MSLPYYHIRCSNCEYTDMFSFDVWYEYAGGKDAVCQPYITQGWCEDCQQVVTICGPQNAETLRDNIKELSVIIKEEEEKRKQWRRLLLRKHADENAISAWKERIAELNDCIELFKKHDYKNKCLSCGSPHVVPVELPDGFREYGNPIQLGVKHECGGAIMIISEGRIGYSDIPKVIYDITGNVVLDERCFPSIDA
jgi:hypothetical protein